MYSSTLDEYGNHIFYRVGGDGKYFQSKINGDGDLKVIYAESSELSTDADTVHRNLSINKYEMHAFSDPRNIIETTRYITDTLTETDEYGNIDLTRGVIDSSNTSDTDSMFSVNRYMSESTTDIDIRGSIDFESVKTDTVINTDMLLNRDIIASRVEYPVTSDSSIRNIITSIKSEYTNISDSISKNISRIFDESSGLYDKYNILCERVISDSISSIDTSIKDITKMVLTDSSSTYDINITKLTRSILDIVISTDIFSRISSSMVYKYWGAVATSLRNVGIVKPSEED